MQGKVEICGVNTARLKTLTHAEMDTLLRLSKAGDKKQEKSSLKVIYGWFYLSFKGSTNGVKVPMICFRWAASV